MSVCPPIIFMVFNRPEKTERVMNAIRQARPQNLFVVADGPRDHVSSDQELCREVKKVIESVDWNCEVMTNYAEKNMGCRKRVSSGITWAFEHTQRAIILEDDCLPDPSFFRYCGELLERFADHPQIMGISGNHFLPATIKIPHSYRFSHICPIWGWATWKRAWAHYDVEMKSFPALDQSGRINDVIPKALCRSYWRKTFRYVHQGKIDTWDHQFQFSSWLQNGIFVVPNVNLVQNIGYGHGATHTSDAGYQTPPASCALRFPLEHPVEVSVNTNSDKLLQKTWYGGGLLSRIFKRIKRLVLL